MHTHTYTYTDIHTWRAFHEVVCSSGGRRLLREIETEAGLVGKRGEGWCWWCWWHWWWMRGGEGGGRSAGLLGCVVAVLLMWSKCGA